jgi:addiction module HigA family antidote
VTDRLPNIPLGDVLLEEFLVPIWMTRARPAQEIGVGEARISPICADKRAMTADTALRLSAFFGTTPGF